MPLNLRERSIFRFSLQNEWLVTVLFCSVLPGTSFGESMNRGTIIVVAQTKHTVIIAGDSRVGETDDGITIKRTNDDVCKLAALGGHTAFGASGVIGNNNKKWTAVSEAVNAVSVIPHGASMSSAQGDMLLEVWSQSMLRHLREFSENQLKTVADHNKGNFTTALLAGVEHDGNAWLHGSMISYGASVLSYRGYTMTSNDPPTAYYNLGKGEIAMEFEESTTERAQSERANWKLMKLSAPDLDRFKTKRLVILTIELAQDKSEVGGAIDQIDLDAQGVRWDALKGNCQYGEAQPPQPIK
jgi:hypothetical protein